jgi:hypothetical protein
MTETRAAYNVGLRMPTQPEIVLRVAVGRPWRCATGQHVLGQVVREGGVRRLHIEAGHVITGHAMIYCPECSQLKEWHSAGDALSQVLSRRGAPVDRAAGGG